MLGPSGVSSNEGKIQIKALAGAERDLGFFSFFFDALEGVWLAAEVDAAIRFEFIDDPSDQGVIPVVTTEMRVAIRSEHFEHAVADFQDADVKGSTSKVIHGDFFIGFAVETVGKSGRSGFIDDAANIETGDLTSSLGGVALAVIEVGRDGNDGFRDGFAQLGFGVRFQLRQNHSADFLGRVGFGFAPDFDLNVGISVGSCHNFIRHAFVGLRQFSELATHETLHGENGVARIGDRLALGCLAHNTLATLGEGDDGRRSARAF